MQQLETLIHELESRISHSDRIKPSVSCSSVGWHIEHTLMTALLIIHAVEKSDPEKYQRKFNPNRLLVFTINKIPRGRGKAPKSVVPTGEFSIQKIKSDFQELKSKVLTLNSLHPSCFFKHPYFGDLNLKGTIKFLNIHTKHHLKIIDDILK
jgi:hypothetical protein